VTLAEMNVCVAVVLYMNV